MIRYTVVEQKNQLSEAEEMRYYPRITQRQNVGLDVVADMIQMRTSFSKGDVIGLIAALEDVIPDLLIDNKTVKLGKLGTFQLHAHTQSSPVKEEVTWRNFLSLKPKCIPGFEIRLGEVHFTKVG